MRTSAVAVLLASSGLARFNKEIAAVAPLQENPDPEFMVGSGDPNDPGSYVYASVRYSQVLELSAPDGLGHALLDQFWIVYVFETWEGDVRDRLAVTLGVARDTLKSPYFGDLRRLRHDVVHHAGIASQANTGKCEVLADWFTMGEPIRLTGSQMRSMICDLFPWDDLLKSLDT
jgi:hypothetical protein